MSPKLKAAAAGALVIVAGIIIFHRTRDWPALPNSPVPLGELIDRSDLIVHANVAKVENPLAPLYSGTNRWVKRAVKLIGARDREFATAHLEILQTVKGPARDRALVDYPVTFAKTPELTSKANGETVVAFVYREKGAYHPVAYSYGTKVLNRKDADVLLRCVAELVAADGMSRRDRERSRAEWFVKLIENPALRWDGAASWLNQSAKPGDALARLPSDLAARVQAVAFRDEPLASGDALLLRELVPSHTRQVVQRVLKYFRIAGERDVDLEQPWLCSSAMELLIQIAEMPRSFRDEYQSAPYPNLSTAGARRAFIKTYLPEIEARLKKVGFTD